LLNKKLETSEQRARSVCILECSANQIGTPLHPQMILSCEGLTTKAVHLQQGCSVAEANGIVVSWLVWVWVAQRTLTVNIS